jgi:hypothetical protein
VVPVVTVPATWLSDLWVWPSPAAFTLLMIADILKIEE